MGSRGEISQYLLNGVGLRPIFCFWWAVMHQDPYNVRQRLEAVVQAMGYELVGVEFRPHSGNALLRIYIDKETGINVDDCEQVSRQVSGVLDVEDPIPGHYNLEVSSPGLDRPLFEAAHFARFVGHRARVWLELPMNGRKKWVGVLKGLREDQVVLESEGTELLIPLERIEKARLVPDF